MPPSTQGSMPFVLNAMNEIGLVLRRIQQEENDQIIIDKATVAECFSGLYGEYEKVRVMQDLLWQCETEDRFIGYRENGETNEPLPSVVGPLPSVVGSIDRARYQYQLVGDRQSVLKQLYKLQWQAFSKLPRMVDPVTVLDKLLTIGSSKKGIKQNEQDIA